MGRSSSRSTASPTALIVPVPRSQPATANADHAAGIVPESSRLRLSCKSASLGNPSRLTSCPTFWPASWPMLICCCQLRDPMISRYHCSFFLQGEQIWVQDMNSCNGTYVNGRLALLPHVLRDGDRLCLASLEFRVELRPGEADSSGRLLPNRQRAAVV